MKKLYIFLAALVVGMGSAQAGGFFIGEQGARAEGMGGAFTGVADDPTAAWFNPAGIAFQEGMSGTLNLDIIVPNNEYTDTFGIGGSAGRTYKAKKDTFATPHGYLVYNMPDSPLAFSLAINTPFGLSTDWTGSGAPFSTTALAAVIPPLAPATVTFSRIEMVNVNPSVAFKVNENFSIAVGLTYYNVFNADLDNPFLRFSGNGDGWGYNLAVLYRNGGLGIGASYRSQVKTDLSGTGVYPLGSAAAALPPGFSTAGSTSITFPDMFNFGVSYQVDPSLLISADVDWVNWTTYDRLVIVQPVLGAGGTLTSVSNWNSTVAFRVGMEWAFADDQKLRLGYVFDPTPIEDRYFTPRIPGNDRQLFNVGYGYAFDDKTSLDLAYSYVLLSDRSQTASAAVFYNGTYKANAHIIAASLTHHF